MQHSRSLKVLLVVCSLYCGTWGRGGRFWGQIFANKCVEEVWYLFLGEPRYPYVVISFCHIKDPENFLKYNETALVKPQAHFSRHRFIVRFSYVETSEQAEIFQRFYERLIVPAPQHTFFEYKGQVYSKVFKQFTPEIFKLEFLRSRWNHDKMTLHCSVGAYTLIKFYEGQQPRSIEKKEMGIRPENLTMQDLRYSALSGYRQHCNFESLNDMLGSLTYDFNYYDRLFCDAFEYHGLKFTTYYNRDDLYHFRGRLLRDELLSTFPPDANAVFYASPKLTFVVLKKNPKIWQWEFGLRPFRLELWIALIVAFMTLEGLRHLKPMLRFVRREKLKREMVRKKIFGVILKQNTEYCVEVHDRFRNFIEMINYGLRILTTSAYSGMILFGILHPLYPWVPTTFTDLNKTNNYLVGTAKSSPEFIKDHLITNKILNGLSQERFPNRYYYTTPADYISKEINEEREMGDSDKRKLHAIALYDDKLNLWMKGRDFIHMTAPVLSRITAASEKVLPEIRYVSLAPGATRLHFLIETIRRVFTAGTWLRWYYLEENYYKNVAPILAKKKLKEMNVHDMSQESNESRPLTKHDFISVFAIKGIALAVAFIVFQIESCLRLGL